MELHSVRLRSWFGFVFLVVEGPYRVKCAQAELSFFQTRETVGLVAD